MAWNSQYHGQMPWDFMASLDPNRTPGAGVDHAATGPSATPGFPPAGFNLWGHRGGWGWGWGGPHHHGGEFGGRRGGRRHGHRRGDSGDEEIITDGEREDVLMNEKDDFPETVRDGGDEHPDPPESVPHPFAAYHQHRGPGMRGRGGRYGGRGEGMRGHAHGSGPRGPHSPPPAYPPHGFAPGFGPMMHAFAQHPIAKGMRDYFMQQQNGGINGDSSFAPPVDIFTTGSGWVLHVALPGAKKEDVGVNWDADKSLLSVSGVVHRPGSEEFLQGLVNGERKIGLFTRDVKLPPEGGESRRGEKEEIDGDGITAKLEDGILVVNVPVVEREWTEVRKVDIE